MIINITDCKLVPNYNPFQNLFKIIVFSFCIAAMTDDGYEIMYQVNHLSHFLMTIELLPVILDTAASCGDCRIVILSSSAHQYGVFEPDNMNCDKGPYDTMSGNNYDRSKLYNVSQPLIVVHSYV
jgi:NAD(P)-dependent dehydrogenase (short-subunit alcohol dehydrogenase family)